MGDHAPASEARTRCDRKLGVVMVICIERFGFLKFVCIEICVWHEGDK